MCLTIVYRQDGDSRQSLSSQRYGTYGVENWYKRELYNKVK